VSAPGKQNEDDEGDPPLIWESGGKVNSEAKTSQFTARMRAPDGEKEEVPDTTTIEAVEADVANITSVVVDGVDVLDLSNVVDNFFDDTNLFRKLAQTDLDAIEICKSYAFDASQVNWHVADTHRWMREYALENKDREYFQRNGLVATIAFDHLGIGNFKCAIGTSHLCRVDCPTVVKSVQDLEVARHVFFTLNSASHLLTVTEIVHVSTFHIQSLERTS
jgi:hypothetical protein